MAILNPHHIKLDGLAIATVAHGLETIRDLDTIPEQRVGLYETADSHGAHVDYDAYYRPRSQRLRAYISPYDADGAVTHANGVAGQRRENIETLAEILGKKADPITVQKLVPHPTSAGSTQTLEADAFATVNAIDGTQLRQIDFTLTHPWPFWHLLSEVGPVAVPATIDLTRATSGCTAPIADMVFVFTGDGRVTHTNPAGGGSRYIDISGSGGATVTVDCGAKTVVSGGSPAWGWFDTNTSRWMEWLPGGTINLTTTGTVTVRYYIAKIT